MKINANPTSGYYNSTINRLKTYNSLIEYMLKGVVDMSKNNTILIDSFESVINLETVYGHQLSTTLNQIIYEPQDIKIGVKTLAQLKHMKSDEEFAKMNSKYVNVNNNHYYWKHLWAHKSDTIKSVLNRDGDIVDVMLELNGPFSAMTSAYKSLNGFINSLVATETVTKTPDNTTSEVAKALLKVDLQKVIGKTLYGPYVKAVVTDIVNGVSKKETWKKLVKKYHLKGSKKTFNRFVNDIKTQTGYPICKGTVAKLDSINKAQMTKINIPIVNEKVSSIDEFSTVGVDPVEKEEYKFDFEKIMDTMKEDSQPPKVDFEKLYNDTKAKLDIEITSHSMTKAKLDGVILALKIQRPNSIQGYNFNEG